MMITGCPDSSVMKHISLLTTANLTPQEIFSLDKMIVRNSLAKVIKLRGHEAKLWQNFIHTERGPKV